MDSMFGKGGRAAETASQDKVQYQIFGTLRQPTAAAAAAAVHAAAAASPGGADEAGVAEALEACKVACLAHLEPFLDGYIWQKEPFQLEVVGEDAVRARGVPAHLAGTSRFGENIEDEWFIVWMLRELTRAFPTLTARVWDNDGEFLLIECAFHLPKWVKPDAVANRVYLHGGELHIVPPAATQNLGPWAKLRGTAGNNNNKKEASSDAGAGAGADDTNAATTVTVDAALWLVRGGDGGDGGVAAAATTTEGTTISGSHSTTLAPKPARDAIASRLDGYPTAAREGMHRAYAVLPARLAHVLDAEPQLVAPAVEAFYERDPEGLKAAARMARFPPEDMSGALVKCTRCLYGQLVRQRFAPPRRYPMPSPANRKAFAAAELGMKLVVGFEMLAAEWARNGHEILPRLPPPPSSSAPEAQAPKPPRVEENHETSETSAKTAEDDEMKEDVEEKRESEREPVGDSTWDAFKASLTRNGYFRGEMTGSATYRQLLAAAVTQYKTSAWSERARAVAAAPARRAAAALAGVVHRGLGAKDLPHVLPSDADDDTWMFEDQDHPGGRTGTGDPDPLERELRKRELERRAMLERVAAGKSSEGARGGAGEAGEAVGAETTGTGGKDGIEADVLAAMAERLKSFMGEKSGHEGVDIKRRQQRQRTNGGEDNDDDDDDDDDDEEEEEEEGLLDAHKFLAELSAALGMDKKNRSGGGGGGGGGGGMMDGVFTDGDDDDDFSDSDDDTSDSDSDSDDDDDSEEDKGKYVYENDRGGNWGGVDATTAVAAAAAAVVERSGNAKEGASVGWSDGVRVSPVGARPARTLDSDDDDDDDDNERGGGFMEEYEKAMRRQLRGTDVAATFSKGGTVESLGGETKSKAKTKAKTEASTSNIGIGNNGGGEGRDGGGRVLPRVFHRSDGGNSARDDDSDTEGSGSSDDDDEDDYDDAEGDEALDIDLNLVESMLASYKGQEGMSGPASNLLASMGVKGIGFNNFGEGDDDDDDDAS